MFRVAEMAAVTRSGRGADWEACAHAGQSRGRRARSSLPLLIRPRCSAAAVVLLPPPAGSCFLRPAPLIHWAPRWAVVRRGEGEGGGRRSCNAHPCLWAWRGRRGGGFLLPASPLSSLFSCWHRTAPAASEGPPPRGSGRRTGCCSCRGSPSMSASPITPATSPSTKSPGGPSFTGSSRPPRTPPRSPSSSGSTEVIPNFFPISLSWCWIFHSFPRNPWLCNCSSGAEVHMAFLGSQFGEALPAGLIERRRFCRSWMLLCGIRIGRRSGSFPY